MNITKQGSPVKKNTELPIYHVITDTETNGVNPGCGVWNIGARILMEHRDCVMIMSILDFNQRCDPDTSIGSSDSATIDWQLEFNKDNWEATKLSTMTERSLVTMFVGHIEQFKQNIDKNSNVYFWSKGNFDYPILEWLIKRYNLLVPWKYNDIMDLRTAMKLLLDDNGEHNWGKAAITKHSGYEDAKNEAHTLSHILEYIRWNCDRPKVGQAEDKNREVELIKSSVQPYPFTPLDGKSFK